jgi:ribosome-associated translation inhibitor RaiA
MSWKKSRRWVAHYFTGSVGGHVVITREGSGYRSECALRLSSGITLHAEGRAYEPYPCFEQAAGKIEGRLRRYKARLKSHVGAAADNGQGQVASYRVEPLVEDEETAEGYNPVVVAEGTEDLKSLSVASAVAELDLSGAPVVVFRHAGSGRVNVIYRRRDGAIGWLDPH